MSDEYEKEYEEFRKSEKGTFCYLQSKDKAVKDYFEQGFEIGQNIMREMVADLFNKENVEQSELWKMCGLKLVGWDYENDCLNEQFQSFQKMREVFDERK